MFTFERLFHWMFRLVVLFRRFDRAQRNVTCWAVRAAGFPDGASSKHPGEQHLVPGVQDHDAVCGGSVDQAAGEHFQLLVGVPLGLQGEER